MTLVTATHLYGDVFERCCKILNKIQPSEKLIKEQIAEIVAIINELREAYSAFSSELYDRIKDIEDKDKQKRVFIDLKKGLPSLVFETDLSETDYMLDCRDAWEDNPQGYYVMELIEAIYDSLLWFDKSNKHVFTRFLDTYQAGDSEVTDIIPIELQNPTNPQTPLTKDATANLFYILRQLHVIKNSISDIDLSKTVSVLTGFSADQIRKTNKNMSEITKDHIKGLIPEILKKLE